MGRRKGEFPTVPTATRLTLPQRKAAESEAARQGLNLSKLLQKWIDERLGESRGAELCRK